MSAGFTSSNLQNLSTHQNSAAYSPSFKCHSRANHAEGMLPPAYYIDVERVRLLGNILGLVTSWAELSLKTFPKSVDMKLWSTDRGHLLSSWMSNTEPEGACDSVPKFETRSSRWLVNLLQSSIVQPPLIYPNRLLPNLPLVLTSWLILPIAPALVNLVIKWGQIRHAILVGSLKLKWGFWYIDLLANTYFIVCKCYNLRMETCVTCSVRGIKCEYSKVDAAMPSQTIVTAPTAAQGQSSSSNGSLRSTECP